MSKQGWLVFNQDNDKVVVLNPDHIVSITEVFGDDGVKLTDVAGQTWAFAQFSANDVAQQIGLVGLSPHASYAPAQEDAQEEPSPVS
jgi:hypothetical protein